MTTDSEVQKKSDFVPAGRRKFTEKILVTKKDKPKKKPQKETRERGSNLRKSNTKSPFQRLHQEMGGHLKEVRRQKTRIEELTKSAINELVKIHDLSNKAKTLQPKNKDIKAKTSQNNNNNNSFGLEYELANMKMIKKILALSTPFEAEPCVPRKIAKKRKKRSVPQSKEKIRTKGHETNGIPKVLIVEDDRTTIKIITHILEQHNFKVGHTSDAEDGLKKAFKEKPDLILLDIMLPGMDGFQLLARLQATKETSRIPVIILSSLSGEKDILKGLERGATDYILKPFSPQILFFKIKKILSLKNEHFADNRHV
jgi:PleD family two-component response regulator